MGTIPGPARQELRASLHRLTEGRDTPLAALRDPYRHADSAGSRT